MFIVQLLTPDPLLLLQSPNLLNIAVCLIGFNLSRSPLKLQEFWDHCLYDFWRRKGQKAALDRHEPRELGWFFQQISLAVVRGNALSILSAGGCSDGSWFLISSVSIFYFSLLSSPRHTFFFSITANFFFFINHREFFVFFRYYLSSAGCLYVCIYVCMLVRL